MTREFTKLERNALGLTASESSLITSLVDMDHGERLRPINWANGSGQHFTPSGVTVGRMIECLRILTIRNQSRARSDDHGATSRRRFRGTPDQQNFIFAKSSRQVEEFFTTGNDAPRGGMDGDWIELTGKGRAYLRRLLSD